MKYAALALLAATFLAQNGTPSPSPFRPWRRERRRLLTESSAMRCGKAEWSGGFSLLNKPEVTVEVQTHFKVAIDKANVYFAVRADERTWRIRSRPSRNGTAKSIGMNASRSWSARTRREPLPSFCCQSAGCGF